MVPDTGFSADSSTDSLPELLTLDAVGIGRFRNRFNQRNAYSALFGGQIVAQALAAADLTVSDRTVHSLHAYFLRAGIPDQPLDFIVDNLRDGRRFSARRISVEQSGKLIFSMECSYRVPIQGFEHQRPSLIAFDPEDGIDAIGRTIAPSPGETPLPDYMLFSGLYPVEIRIPFEEAFFRTAPVPKRHYWLRAPSAADVENPAIQRHIFAYLSDFLLAGAALVPHMLPLPGPHVSVASLDHSIWFHRPVRCDDWLLFETDSPSARGGVNLSRGFVYDRAGHLVATVMQEALQLPTDPGPSA